MVTLTLLHPQQATPLEQWRFESEDIIRIGRSPDNHVVLTDSRVSRYHLELRRIELSGAKAGGYWASGAWRMVNLGTNGTLLDGKLVSQDWLQNGALLQLAQGGPKLKFQIEPTPQPKAATKASCNHAGNLPGNLFCIHCGEPLQVERTIRQYRVLRRLGQGGMGTTYLAWIPPGEEKGDAKGLVVVKEMNAEMAEISKAQELFEREARTLKALHHPGIPQFFDFFAEGGKKYLVMELVHGQDLEKRISKFGPVAPQQAIAWAIQTCEVLDYIHGQNPPLIHRDIKPANLLVKTLDNRIVVLDFGAVKEIGTPLGTRIGAEGYSAPEQDRGQPMPQSDLYAVGTTLIFLLTGEMPLKFYQKQGKNYLFDVQGVPTIAPKLRLVIERITKHNVRDRYLTAKELSAALAACL